MISFDNTVFGLKYHYNATNLILNLSDAMNAQILSPAWELTGRLQVALGH